MNTCYLVGPLLIEKISMESESESMEIELNYTVIKTNTRLGTTIKKELLPRLLGNSHK